MSKKPNCVLLIDDDEPTNFLHRIVLEEHMRPSNIMVAETVKEALKLLEQPETDRCKDPELIFLDLNMPGLNGWDFLEKLNRSEELLDEGTLIYILTTSINPDDRKKAKETPQVAGFLNKPLTDEIVREILQEHFA